MGAYQDHNDEESQGWIALHVVIEPGCRRKPTVEGEVDRGFHAEKCNFLTAFPRVKHLPYRIGVKESCLSVLLPLSSLLSPTPSPCLPPYIASDSDVGHLLVAAGQRGSPGSPHQQV